MNTEHPAKACCVTGHRFIAPEKRDYVTSELKKEILRAVEDGYTHFISGFSEGVDLLFASIVADLSTKNANLTLEAAIPYRGRLNTTNELFQQLLYKCCMIGIHGENFDRTCFFNRNRFMISVSQRVIAVYDGREKGGTFFMMRYAYSKERDVRIIKI